MKLNNNKTFISYKHEDVDFASKIFRSLKACGINAWWDSDENDIRTGAEWRSEILLGVQNCFNIVFIISPLSLRSGECMAELRHALLLNKRLIPILYKDVDVNEAPAALSKIQWLDFRHDFTEPLKELLTLLNSPLGLSFGDSIHSKVNIYRNETFLKELYLEYDKYLIGRIGKNPPESLFESGMITIQDDKVSLVHLTLKLKQRWLVVDGYGQFHPISGQLFSQKPSTNGLYFNDEKKRLAPGISRTLISGDKLRLTNSIWIRYQEFRSHEPTGELIDPQATLPELPS